MLYHCAYRMISCFSFSSLILHQFLTVYTAVFHPKIHVKELVFFTSADLVSLTENMIQSTRKTVVFFFVGEVCGIFFSRKVSTEIRNTCLTRIHCLHGIIRLRGLGVNMDLKIKFYFDLSSITLAFSCPVRSECWVLSSIILQCFSYYFRRYILWEIILITYEKQVFPFIKEK